MATRAARLLAEWQIPSPAKAGPSAAMQPTSPIGSSTSSQQCKAKVLLRAPIYGAASLIGSQTRFCAPQPVTFLLQQPPFPALSSVQRALGARARRLPLAIPFPQSTAAGKQVADSRGRGRVCRTLGARNLRGESISLNRRVCRRLPSRRNEIESAFRDASTPALAVPCSMTV